MDEATYVKMHYRWRSARVIMYAALVAAGIFTNFFLSPIIASQVGTWTQRSWAIILVASALLCLYGSFTDKWIGEYAGLPSLFSVIFLYGVSSLLDADKESLHLLARGLIVIAFSAGLFARWQDVKDIKNASREGIKSE